MMNAKSDNTTLFAETRNYMLKKIAELLAAGEKKLPTERELAEEVVASYATVRLVMKQLETEGFIRRIRGSGTYLELEAEALLRQSSMRRLWYFRSPDADQPERDYGSWMRGEIRRSAAERNWNLMEEVVFTHDEFLTGLSQRLKPGDAVLYLPPTEPISVRQLGELSRYDSFPLVVLDLEFGDVSIANVTSDNRRGGMLAARQLLKNGSRTPLVLLCEPHLKQLRSRLQGFCEITEIAGITPELLDCGVSVNDDREEFAYRTLLGRLKRGSLPDAVFAISDSGAFGALRAMRECGLEPGRDVGLIGFDGVSAGRKMTPSLATIAQPVAGICRTAFDILEKWVPGRRPQYQLSPEFCPGETLLPLQVNCKQEVLA